MSRLRYNGLSTTLGGSGLTNVATSVTFAAALTHSNGTNVPTIVAPDYIPLAILGATGHLSEIVYLTAYTAAGTTGTITRGVEGTTGSAHSSGDIVTQAQLVADPAGGTFAAPDHGYQAWAFDPALSSGANVSASTGAVYVVKIPTPTSITVTSMSLYFQSTGTLTAGQSFAGLYDSTGTRLVVSADQSTAWSGSSGGVVNTALSPTTITGPWVWASILMVGSPIPPMRGLTVSTGALLSAGLSAANSRFARVSTGATSLPTSFTPSSLNVSFALQVWVALS